MDIYQIFRDGPVFLWAFASRVLAFLDFFFAISVPAFLYKMFFAFPHTLVFLFRVPMLMQLRLKYATVITHTMAKNILYFIMYIYTHHRKGVKHDDC